MNALIQIPFAWQKSTAAILCMVFALFLMTSGCESSSNEMTLTGTAWKLVGIVDTEAGELKELEPKDCVGCYSFIFDTDSTFGGYTSINTMYGKYEFDYNTHTYHLIFVVSTEIAERGDGSLYDQILSQIQSVTIESTLPRMLHLNYNGGKNYLLFKPKELLQSQF